MFDSFEGRTQVPCSWHAAEYCIIITIISFYFLSAVPTAELVKRVKELYHKRVSDVRFLIPVLTGLTKQEIIAVLPKLIKQSPSVVKEVFNRLLGCFHSKYNKVIIGSVCYHFYYN